MNIEVEETETTVSEYAEAIKRLLEDFKENTPENKKTLRRAYTVLCMNRNR